jgi:prefoldin subunit 5
MNETIKIDDVEYKIESLTDEGKALIRTISDANAEINHLRARYNLVEYALQNAQIALAAEKEKFEEA